MRAATSAPTASPLRSAAATLLLAGSLASAVAGCQSCQKKEQETAPPGAPPPPGGASPELVSTGLGMGLALDAHAAPTSTRWERVLVLGEDTAVVTGRSLDQAIALRTDDRGRSWRALRAPAAGAEVFWSAADDGTLALSLATRAHVKVAPGAAAPLESLRLLFAEPQQTELGGPVPVFPKGSAPEGAGIPWGTATPAVWSGAVAAVLVSTGGRRAALAYGAPAGRKLPSGSAALPAEQFVAAPYGRPPSLLSVGGGSLYVRPWPKPGEEVEPPIPLPGFRAGAATSGELGAGPDCESGAWSFRRVTAGPSVAHLVGISPNRALAFALPRAEGKLVGCSADAVVLETVDEATHQPTLIRCALDGQCAQPQSPPFRYWTGEHQRTLAATATAQGIVATMAARAGARWGLYLAQSLDQGKLFELPRVIGEGTTDRGYVELGAIVGWSKRVLLLVSADVTGTSRRGWYVLASDDGGTDWGPP